MCCSILLVRRDFLPLRKERKKGFKVSKIPYSNALYILEIFIALEVYLLIVMPMSL